MCGQLLEPLWGALEFLVNQLLIPVCGLNLLMNFEYLKRRLVCRQ